MIHDTESGFTLIEVLLAVAVFAIGLLGLGMMQAHFAEGNAQARQLTTATDIALNKMEEFINNDPDEIASDKETITDYPIDYELAWTVEEFDREENTDMWAPIKKVDLEVTWKTGEQDHEVAFNWVINR